jgi:molybdopterin-guanine dinucleotide biosynthesis protein A
MGRDKAAIRIPDRTGSHGRTLAVRTAEMLLEVCSFTVEVGGGHSGLEWVLESPPGSGPLAAMAAGWRFLAGRGWHGPALVVATDLPRLNTEMLRWLAGHPASGSVVPVVGGRVQPLCARYSPSDLDEAARLAASGRRAVRDLFEVIDAVLVPPEDWAPEVGGVGVLSDVDTPEDLRRMTGSDWPEDVTVDRPANAPVVGPTDAPPASGP